MKFPPPAVRIIGLLLIVVAAGYWFLYGRNAPSADSRLQASGTIEVRAVSISPEMGGRVTEIGARVGDAVTAGQRLVQFDTTLLEGNLTQALAQVAAAQANYDLLAAGASAEQIAAAEATVTRVQAALDAVDEQITQVDQQADEIAAEIEQLTDEIANNRAGLTAAQMAEGQPTPDQVAAIAQLQGQSVALSFRLQGAQRTQSALRQQQQILAAQRIAAETGVDAAIAQRNILTAGARKEQLAAAAAQVTAADATVALVQSQIDRQTLTAPLDGVVLSQAIEVGEVAAPSASLLVIGDLADLTLTVFVPEDRYGQIVLGQSAEIRVDSFPDVVFSGTVQRIADRAQFTPRNVQTAEGRTSTVYAVELSVADDGQRLKPGMPADVTFDS